MTCKYCGKEIEENSRFCTWCGENVVPKEKKCSECGNVLEDNAIFCKFCGTRWQECSHIIENDHSTEIINEYPDNTSQDTPSDEPLKYNEKYKLTMMSLYEGDVSLGVAKATGDIIVYDDHLEFKSKFGNPGWAMLGLAGLLIGSGADKSLIIKYSDVVDVKRSKYGMVMPSMVISMKDGKKLTFAGTINGSTIDQAVWLIRHKIK